MCEPITNSFAREEWRDIPNCHGRYQASNMGRIACIKPSGVKILKPSLFRTGYVRVSIFGKSRSVHRLVALAFLDNPCNLPCINHIDEDKTNNKVSNLEWCNHKYNNSYGTRLANVSKAMSIPIIAIKDGVETEYQGLATCARILHLNLGHIGAILKGHRMHCKGYTFRYKEESRNRSKI